MTPTPSKLLTATVKILRVQESRTRSTWQRPEGRRRFVIQAEQTTGESLGERLIGLTTLDPWKASLALQAKEQGLTLFIKYKRTPWFDAELLSVETVKDSQVSA